jgi:hypothetical protein
MKRLMAGLAIMVMSAIMALAGSAGPASAARPGGNERFTIVLTGPTTTSGPVTATGAFHAFGNDVEQQFSPSVGQSVFTFGDGTLTAIHTDNPGGSFTFNPAACVGRASGTGTYTLAGGTGAYAGVTGHGTYRFRAVIIQARTATGCGAQIGGVTVIRASGPVTFA